MKHLVTVAALTSLAVMSVAFEPPEDKARAAEVGCERALLGQATAKRTKGARAACKGSAAKRRARAHYDGISAEDTERLDRAMARNVLQSIEDELRRQRVGD